MPVFKSPTSNRTHAVPEYDAEEYILNNSSTKERILQNDYNHEVLTETNWNLHRWSAKKDRYNDITLDKQKIVRLNNRMKRIQRPKKLLNY